MANILALDTSTDACSVALEVNGERTEIFKVIPRKHTHELLPMVEQILAQAQLKVNQLDAIAFGRGPGSFAGIRIATGVAQGFAFAADLAVVPVSTLATLAQGYYRQHGSPEQLEAQQLIITALDARMDEVYWGGYKIVDNIVQRVIDESVCAPAKMQINIDNGQSCVGVGSGFNYQEQMPTSFTQILASVNNETHPHSQDILAIASVEFALGNTVRAEDAQPVYLRNQVAWKKKDQQ